MTERPILFSGAMVRALLAGTKTQTRRVVKMKKHHQIEQRDDGTNWPWMYDGERDDDSWMRCPYGQPGDQLWVREAWARTRVFGAEMVVYREGDNRTDYGGPWKPSIHMPRTASRITLEITSARVERLQDISESDAMAEGTTPITDPCDHVRLTCADIGCSGPQPYRTGFRALWRDINGPDSWEANPWVWAVEFKPLEVRQ